MAVFFDIETTGLDPYQSQVTAIGMKADGVIRLWKVWESEDEHSMIMSALDDVKRVEETVVGFNNLKFDVPFMLKRLEVLGHPSPELWALYSKKWFDLYQYLGNDFRSQRYWLDKAEIKEKHPELRGRDMPTYFSNGDYSKIESHIVDDLNTSEALFKFLKQRNPEFLRFD
ncbi:MAG: ribonuclease H-like domain-containing protein [Nitrososphaerales archaeon]|jgi:uncharacterized protein YprB with RNaseH-like and TPR domain